MASADVTTGRATTGRLPGGEALPPTAPVRARSRLRRVRARIGLGLRAFAKVVGSLLRIAFALAALRAIGVLHPGRSVVAHAIVIVVAFMVVAGPWFLRLARSLSFERAARIREQERADVAAHLHDSVLQTLALIQTRSSDGAAVATLARRQERALRRWLFERPDAHSGEGDTIGTALELAAGEVEELHGVPIEAVIVGDGRLDMRAEALVQATREAMTNAAKFARCERIDLYAEIEATRIVAFVRDRGVGFDADAVPSDRRGLRDSILGRMRRHGGRATVHSAPGEGTEIELLIELQPA
ncbi:MAG TPA: ATP-binding protein [Solirubrobacteraceae bacterium]